jgi:hypothetical protein
MQCLFQGHRFTAGNLCPAVFDAGDLLGCRFIVSHLAEIEAQGVPNDLGAAAVRGACTIYLMKQIVWQGYGKLSRHESVLSPASRRTISGTGPTAKIAELSSNPCLYPRAIAFEGVAV